MGAIRKLLIAVQGIAKHQKIANVLSTLDTKIQTVEAEMSGLAERKKGLLQQLFV